MGMHYKEEFGATLKKVDLLLGICKPPKRVDVSTAEGLIDRALVICEASEFAVLSNKDLDGNVTSRMIEPFKTVLDPCGGPVLSFNTNKLSRKFKQLKKDPMVTVTYMDKKRLAYVTFVGEARQIEGPESKRYWIPSLTLFYPEGNDEAKGSRFTAWEVVPKSLTICDISHGVVSTRQDWNPPELVRDAKEGTWSVVSTGKEAAAAAAAAVVKSR